MAEPKRFHFDSEARSVGVASTRRGGWMWVALSLILHGGIILFALMGAARGGHSQLAGTVEVAVVGPPAAGDPDTRAGESARETLAPVERPEPVPPRPPQPAALARPAPASAPEAAQPTPAAPAPRAEIAPPPTSDPIDPEALLRKAQSAKALPAAPRSPKADIEPRRPRAAAAAPASAALARPRTARAPNIKPSRAAALPSGLRNASPGETASLGTPSGGERLGRTESDDGDGLLNVNMNPRFRVPPAPPHYPRLAIERDEEGVVLIRAIVDPAGAPRRVVVWRSSGFPLLDGAALDAVGKWRFEPKVRGGRAVVSWVQVPVRFRLR